MARYTQPGADGPIISLDNISTLPNGIGGPAVQRLAQFEDLYDHIVAEQERITREMEALRLNGKEKSVKFRELFANKLLNNSMLTHFQAYGIDQ